MPNERERDQVPHQAQVGQDAQSYQGAIIQDLDGGNRVEGGVWWFAACVLCLTVGGQSQAGRVRDPMR